MCGRFASSRSPQELGSQFDAHYEPPVGFESLTPSYNVAPTDAVHIVRESYREEQPHRVISIARWGLVPSWAKDLRIGSRMFNARAEEVASKPAFRTALARRRCLVPADGWYEWAAASGASVRKQPYFMTSRAGGVLALAGLWEVWHAPDSDVPVFSTTVLTGPAFGEFAAIHDRMPLILSREYWAGWLGENASDTVEAPDLVARIIAELPGRDLERNIEFRPVGASVGNVRHNGPELIKRVEPAGNNEPQQLF